LIHLWVQVQKQEELQKSRCWGIIMPAGREIFASRT
jgi:hypothetical protein